MPSLHFGGSPYGHVKPPLLQALSLKRKKSRVAAVAAATVFKVFTSTRGRDAIIRQGVKYRNMFHAGGGLVRERQPGEEVTQEKGWVTDEESEHSEAEGSEEEVIPVVVKAEDVVERFQAEQETMEEAEALVVAFEEEEEEEEEEELTMNLIHEAEEIANTDLLKLEISLAEKEIPQVPVSQAPTTQAKEEVVEAEVMPAQESTSETPIGEAVEKGIPVVVLPKEVKQQIPEEPPVFTAEQAPEQLVVSLEQVKEQESVTEVIAQFEEKIVDVVLVPEPQPELVLGPPHPEPLSLTSVMNLLEPAEREPLTFTTVMNVLQPAKPEPAPSIVAMEVVEIPIPEPSSLMAVVEIADVQQPEPILLEVKEVEVSPLDDILGEIQEKQEDTKADDIDTPGEIQEEQEDIKVNDIDILGEIQEKQEDMTVNDIDTPGEIQEEQEQPDIKAGDTVQQTEAEIQEALVEVEETKTLSEEPILEDEAVDTSPNSSREPEVQETMPMTQLPLPPLIIEPTLEAQSKELTVEIVEKVLPIHMQVISPQAPQETPVLAISEKHSEQLFDDEYDETELNEDEEPEVEAELENLDLEGS